MMDIKKLILLFTKRKTIINVNDRRTENKQKVHDLGSEDKEITT